MKKTKSTLMTAAILTAAAMGSHTVTGYPSEATQTKYGPPPAYTTVTEEEEYPPFPTTQPAYGPPVAYTTVTEEEEYPPFPPPQPTYGPPSAFYDKGDINMDNKINIADYNKMLSAVQGEELYSAEELADIDNDGSIDEDDVDAMRKYLTGQTDSLG